mmetsp:Transcript_93022/g.207858  ORF Transcript_93022/g.207858 Transcript_93022/m.207858 type:complete len:249 (-) Transcript_93022:48-794(-)
MYADFDWASAPLSSRSAPIIGGLAYLISIGVLVHVLPSGGIKGLKWALVAHNMFLSAASLCMFLGCLVEMLARHSREGNAYIFCESPVAHARGPLYFWAYIFYLSKYYEMADTFLALLKGSKPPHFKLHVYHHALVPMMVWAWLEYCGTLQFPGLLTNTFVHTIMYAYYALKIIGFPTPWKAWVTRLQILQFAMSLGFLGITWTYIRADPFGKPCSGLPTMWVNIVFNLSFLWRFVVVLHSSPSQKST